MAEQPPRKRRIIRRVMIALAVVMLLVNLYVSSYFAVVWACFRGYIPEWHLVVIYKPLNEYRRTSWIGSREFRAMKDWAMNPNHGFTDAYEFRVKLEEKASAEVATASDSRETAAETISD